MLIPLSLHAGIGIAAERIGAQLRHQVVAVKSLNDFSAA